MTISSDGECTVSEGASHVSISDAPLLLPERCDREADGGTSQAVQMANLTCNLNT